MDKILIKNGRNHMIQFQYIVNHSTKTLQCAQLTQKTVFPHFNGKINNINNLIIVQFVGIQLFWSLIFYNQRAGFINHNIQYCQISSPNMNQLSSALNKNLADCDQKANYCGTHPDGAQDLSSTQDLDSQQICASRKNKQITQEQKGTFSNQSFETESKQFGNFETGEISEHQSISIEQKEEKEIPKKFQHPKFITQSVIQQPTSQVIKDQEIVTENIRLTKLIKKTMLENHKLLYEVLDLVSRASMVTSSLNDGIQECSQGDLKFKIQKLQSQNCAYKQAFEEIQRKIQAAQIAHYTDWKSDKRSQQQNQLDQECKEDKLLKQMRQFYEENKEIGDIMQDNPLQHAQSLDHESDQESSFMSIFLIQEIQKLGNNLRRQSELRKKFEQQNKQLSEQVPVILEQLSSLSQQIITLNALNNKLGNVSKIDDLETEIKKLKKENKNLDEDYNEVRQAYDKLCKYTEDEQRKAIKRRNNYERNVEDLIRSYESRIKNILKTTKFQNQNMNMSILREEVERLQNFLNERNQYIGALKARNDEAYKKLNLKQIQVNELLEQAKTAIVQKFPDHIDAITQIFQENKLSPDFGEDSQKQIEKLNKIIEKNKKKIAQLEIFNKSLFDNIQKVRLQNLKEFDKHYQQLCELRQALKSEQAKNNESNDQTIELREKYRAEASKKKHLERIIEQLTIQFTKLKNSIILLKQDKLKTIKENNQLKIKLNEMLSSGIAKA